MNHFEYTVAMEKISNLKTLKSKRSFIDEIITKAVAQRSWGRSTYPESEDLDIIIRQFRCITRINSMYNNATGFPLYISTTINDFESTILRKAIEYNVSKAILYNAFEFRNIKRENEDYYSVANALSQLINAGSLSTVLRLKIIDAVRDIHEQPNSI